MSLSLFLTIVLALVLALAPWTAAAIVISDESVVEQDI
jgi:hypothetical protein